MSTFTPAHLGKWEELFHRLTGSARHAPHDYVRAIAALGGCVDARRTFRLYGCGPAWIEGLVAHWSAESTR